MRKNTVRIIATLLVMVLVSLPLTGCAPDRNLIEEHTWYMTSIIRIDEEENYIIKKSTLLVCSPYLEEEYREDHPDDDFKVMEMTLTAINGTLTLSGDSTYTGTYEYDYSGGDTRYYLNMYYEVTMSGVEGMAYVHSDPEVPGDDDHMYIRVGEYEINLTTEAKLKEDASN